MWKPKRLRPYLPNYSDQLALVSQDDERPYRAHWRLRLWQLVGGKTWSLSVVRYATPKPELIPHQLVVEDMIAYMDLHTSHYQISQLTTEQKELWADMVDASCARLAKRKPSMRPARRVDRWWK